MKFEKKTLNYVKIGLTSFLIALLLGICIGYAAVPSSTFTISPGVYPGAPSFTVWKEETNYFAKDANGALASTGTNASQTIQSVIASLPATGGLIFIKAGLYVLDTPLNITKNAVYLQGEGYSWGFIDQANALLPNYQTILQASSSFPSNKFMINFHPPTGKNVMVGGGLQSLVVCGGIENTPFENPADNTWYSGGGVYIYNTHAVRITDCTFLRHGGCAIYAFSSLQGGYLTGGGISDIQIERNMIRTIGYGNDVGNSTYPQKASGVGIYLDIGCWVSTVINNYVSICYDYGIAVMSWGGRIVDNYIEKVYSRPDKDPYSPSDPTTDVWMSGSGIWTREYGILIEGNNLMLVGHHGIISYSDNSIVGNHITSPNTENHADGAGIYAEGNNLNLTIVGNTIIDANPFYGSPPCGMRYGISVAGATNSASTIVGNNIMGAITQSIWETNCTVACNVGWVTENSGFVYFNNEATKEVTHGLAGAPTCEIITPTFLTANPPYISYTDATIFTIVFNGTVTGSVNWYAVYKP